MKRVSFAQRPEIVFNETPTSEEEEALMFYSKSELAQIIHHCKDVIMGKTKDECMRGLELFNNREQRTRLKIIIRDILQEQRGLRTRDGIDEKAFAEVAQELTAERLKKAQARAKQDTKAAREGLWERIKRSSLRFSGGSYSRECRRDIRQARRAFPRSPDRNPRTN